MKFEYNIINHNTYIQKTILTRDGTSDCFPKDILIFYIIIVISTNTNIQYVQFKLISTFSKN